MALLQKAEPEVAVCLLPGTELAFADEVKYDDGWIWTKSTSFRVGVCARSSRMFRIGIMMRSNFPTEATCW